jgi:hypothetical protein
MFSRSMGLKTLSQILYGGNQYRRYQGVKKNGRSSLKNIMIISVDILPLPSLNSWTNSLIDSHSLMNAYTASQPH